LADAKAAEEAAVRAEQEQIRALDELRAQQEAHAKQIADLERLSVDDSKSTVQKSKAANEAAQLKAKDSLPLQKAKIDQGATVRTAERARKFANEEKSKAEAATAKAEARMNEAVAFLVEVQSRGGEGGKGALWWMSRTLEEKRKYMPKSKGGNW